jgi:hypothetical protein
MKHTIAISIIVSYLYSLNVYSSACPSLVFRGAIDEKYHITLRVDDPIAFLYHDDEWAEESFTGSYVYDKYNKPLKITATRQSLEEIVFTEETGTFNLKFINNSLIGIWTANSGKILPVSLISVPVRVEYESSVGLFQGFVSLVDGGFRSTIEVGSADVELYSWDVYDCMNNNLRGPSVSEKLVNGENLYLVEWTIEYKPYGVLPANESVLIHPNGGQIDLSSGSSGSRFGMYEYHKTNCCVDI